MPFNFLRRFVGLYPSQSQKQSLCAGIEQTRKESAKEKALTQIRFSAAWRECYAGGMTHAQAKSLIEACADNIKAGIQPWECGCIFNDYGERLKWCGKHEPE